MKNQHTICLFCLIMLAPILAKASIEDTALAKCYQLERTNTELAIKHINQKQLDSLDLLYQSLPLKCSEYAWNLLIKVFLMCTKYPQQIDSITQPEMDFIIQYVHCVRYKNFVYGMGEDHEYYFNQMHTFIGLHNAVQQYLDGIYIMLPIGTNQSNLIGTLIGKQTLFFDRLNNENNILNNVSYQSLIAQKKKLREIPLVFLSLNTAFSVNRQIGNSFQFNYASIEIKEKQTLFGFSVGIGFNTTEPNYTIVYNRQEMYPGKNENWDMNIWYNHLIFKEAFINPFIGAGIGLQERQESVMKGRNDVGLSITTRQLYPEVGFLFGRWPNYLLKLNCSYRFSSYGVSYRGETAIGESTFGDNLNQNEWRIGLTVLIDIKRDTRQKGKIIGVR